MGFQYIFSVCLLAILVLSDASAAVTNNWQGGAGLWNEPSNWSLGHVPLDSEDVVINSNGNVIIPNGISAVARTINLATFGRLTLGHIANLSLLEVSAGIDRIDNRGVIDNFGTITIDSLESGSAGILNASFATFTNEGTIHVMNYEGSNTIGIKNQTFANFINTPTAEMIIEHTLDISASAAIANQTNATFTNQGNILLNDIRAGISNLTGATIENSGTLTIRNCKASAGISNQTSAQFNNTLTGNIVMDTLNALAGIEGIYNSASFTNEGTIDINKTSDAGIVNRNPNTQFVNNGSITLTNIGGVDGVLNTSSALYSGAGSIVCDKPFQQSAQFDPGLSPGVIQCIGDFEHASNSIDTFEIAGYEGGGMTLGHDSVYVDGDLHLDGNLVILRDGFYTPHPAAEFVLFEYTGTLSGTFTNISLPIDFPEFEIDISTPGKVLLKDPNCVLATNTWIGGNGSYTIPFNWSLGHVPTECERAVIQNGDSVTLTSGIFSAQSLLIDNAVFNISGSNARYNIEGNLMSNQGIEIINGGTLYNDGQIIIEQTDGIGAYGCHITDGEVFNQGTIIIAYLQGDGSIGMYVDGNSTFRNRPNGFLHCFQLPAQGIRVSPGATIENEGDIRIWFLDSSDAILNLGTIHNHLNAEIEIEMIAEDGFSHLGQEVINEGYIVINDCGGRGFLTSVNAIFTNNGILEITNTENTNIQVGPSTLLRGNGVFELDGVLSLDGKLSPGTSIGQMEVNGIYNKLVSSVDTFEIAGLAGGGIALGHDSIHVDGDLLLNGELVIETLNSYTPPDSEKFILYTYTGTLAGAFSAVTLPPSMNGWFIDYSFPGRIELKKIVCAYDENVYQGGALGKWNTASNWSLGHIPLPCEKAIIETPDSVIIIGGVNAEAISVLVENGAVLSIEQNASLTIDAEYLLNDGLHCSNSKVYNDGTLTISNLWMRDGIINFNQSSFFNRGSIQISQLTGWNADGVSNIDSATFINEASGQISIQYADNLSSSSIGNALSSLFVNEGMIFLEGAHGISNISSSTFENNGDIDAYRLKYSVGLRNQSSASFSNSSSGTIYLEKIGGISLLTSGIKNSAFFLNDGSIEIDSIANNGIENSSASAIFINNGNVDISNANLNYSFEASDIKNISDATLKGAGTFNLTQSIRNESFLLPGNSPGAMTVNGVLEMTPSSIDTFEIAGTGGGGQINGHDSIYMSGEDLILNGKLVIQLLDGFVPSDNDTFTLFQYTQSISGTFSIEEFPLEMTGFAVDLSKQGSVRILKKPCTAATNDWIGGNGMWSNPVGWSLGHVPEYCETVRLNNGDTVLVSNGYQAFARSVQNNGGSLTLEENAHLMIQVDGNSLSGCQTTQGGSTTNSGTITIHHTNGFNAGGLEVGSNSQFTNFASGIIDISNINGTSSEGLLNLGTFVNEGAISIQDVANSYGIFHSLNGDLFDNQGEITVENTGLSGLFILATAVFNNTGNLSIEGAGLWGISTSSGGLLNNIGTIEVRE